VISFVHWIHQISVQKDYSVGRIRSLGVPDLAIGTYFAHPCSRWLNYSFRAHIISNQSRYFFQELSLYVALKTQKHYWVNEKDEETLNLALSWVYTSSFRMHLLHCVAIFYKIPWFCSTMVIYEKLQCNAEKACGNRMCKRAFKYLKQYLFCL